MLIFLENLAGGTLIRVGSLIRHCIVHSKHVLFSPLFFRFLHASEYQICGKVHVHTFVVAYT